jgi:uncharacterized membrane protein (UPF0127 family)
MTHEVRYFQKYTRTFLAAGARVGAIAVLLTLFALGGMGRTVAAQAGAPTASCPILGRAPRPGIDYDARYAIITFTNQCGQSVPLAVDIAADEQRRETGLMNITALPADQGELFVFSDIAHGAPVRLGFWMKDTLVPLSIAFVGTDGTVQEIQDMQPETLDNHLPALPYLYAIEANQGWFASHGIAAGSPVNLQPALAVSQ